MRWARRRVIVFVRFAACFAACVATLAACIPPSVDEYASGALPPGLADASPSSPPPPAPSVDASVAPDASAPGDLDAGVVNLLASNLSGFEQGNCEGSGFFQANLIGVNTPHTGMSSCRVCRNVPSGNFTIDQPALDDPVVGAEYRASAWVRRPVLPTNVSDVKLYLRVHDGDFAPVQEEPGTAVTITDDWQRLEVALTVGRATKKLDVYAGGSPPLSGPSGSCFLIDDIVVWRAK